MSHIPASVRDFLDRFCQWSRGRPDIDAVALVGSYARGAAAKESDVDLVILTSHLERFFGDQSWVSTFGEAAETREENWGKAQSLRVFYKNELEIEYSFALPAWAESPLDSETVQVVSKGIKIVFDPRGILAKLQREVCATLGPGEK